jgi:hypothetical protein
VLLGVAALFLRAFVFLNGFGIALFGTESIFFAASRNLSHASAPSIMSAVPIFMLPSYGTGQASDLTNAGTTISVNMDNQHNIVSVFVGL